MQWQEIKHNLREIRLNIEVCIEYVALAAMLLILGTYSLIVLACVFVFDWVDQFVQFTGKLLHIKK